MENIITSFIINVFRYIFLSIIQKDVSFTCMVLNGLFLSPLSNRAGADTGFRKGGVWVTVKY